MFVLSAITARKKHCILSGSYSVYTDILILSPLINKKKQKKTTKNKNKNVVQVASPPLTKRSGSAHEKNNQTLLKVGYNMDVISEYLVIIP